MQSRRSPSRRFSSYYSSLARPRTRRAITNREPSAALNWHFPEPSTETAKEAKVNRDAANEALQKQIDVKREQLEDMKGLKKESDGKVRVADEKITVAYKAYKDAMAARNVTVAEQQRVLGKVDERMQAVGNELNDLLWQQELLEHEQNRS